MFKKVKIVFYIDLKEMFFLDKVDKLVKRNIFYNAFVRYIEENAVSVNPHISKLMESNNKNIKLSYTVFRMLEKISVLNNTIKNYNLNYSIDKITLDASKEHKDIYMVILMLNKT